METKKNQNKIVLVDDHPIVVQGLSELINQHEDLVVCATAENAVEALKAIQELNPDLVIVDLTLKDCHGLELIESIRLRWSNLFILVLSMHDESLFAKRCLRAGARGYIMKQEATENVVAAIDKVLGGQVYVSQEMATKMVGNLVGGKTESATYLIDRLSDREVEVFRLIGQGHGTREIAQKLHLSIKTIETYRAHIKEKLNLSSAGEMLRYAIQWTKSLERG